MLKETQILYKLIVFAKEEKSWALLFKEKKKGRNLQGSILEKLTINGY
jgi:hypothetical protein